MINWPCPTWILYTNSKPPALQLSLPLVPPIPLNTNAFINHHLGFGANHHVLPWTSSLPLGTPNTHPSTQPGYWRRLSLASMDTLCQPPWPPKPALTLRHQSTFTLVLMQATPCFHGPPPIPGHHPPPLHPWTSTQHPSINPNLVIDAATHAAIPTSAASPTPHLVPPHLPITHYPLPINQGLQLYPLCVVFSLG